jgi:hypothetical protein
VADSSGRSSTRSGGVPPRHYPADRDPAKIDARYQNGVLTIMAPMAEHAMPRQIKVKI